MDWREHYKSRLVTAEEAVRVVKSGDLVYIPVYPQPQPLIYALAARRKELKGVNLWIDAPAYDPGWLQPGWQDSFEVTAEMIIGDLARPAYEQRLIDYSPMIFSSQFKGYKGGERDGKLIDALMLVVSPPDDHGFCSFGANLWSKHDLMKVSRKVVAQVDEGQIRTYGDNYAHVTEFDYFVEHTPPVMSDEEANEMVASAPDPESRAELEKVLTLMDPRQRLFLLPRIVGLPAPRIREFAVHQTWYEPSQEIKRIAEYVAELMRDGDTFQVGTGTPSQLLVKAGAFEGKRDLGWHSEMTAPGVISLIEKGVITGERKTINRGIAVFTGLIGATPREIDWAHENPLIEQRDAKYVVNVRTIAQHDNMVSLNNAISVDFSGQINAESIFGRQMSGTGGQLDFQMGAVLSKGGRAMTLLRSTAAGGAVSRIVPQLEEGATVTVPRTFADTVVTEYGVARLLGKSIRERAKELINIAHPDFRADLKRAAERLFYP